MPIIKKLSLVIVILAIFYLPSRLCYAVDDFSQQTIFDDKLLLNGYSDKYANESKEIIIAMIKDDNLGPFKMAATIRVFKKKYSAEVFSREKRIIEKTLIRRLNRAVSPFVQVEIMHTLCRMDRYKYFNSMIPALILKLGHYNATVNELAYEGLSEIIETGNNRTREARIVFNTLRKVLFLSRKRLAQVTEPDARLKRKLKILRWSIKVLGSRELKRLPKEVLSLL